MKIFFAVVCVLVIIFLFPFTVLGTILQSQVLTASSMKQIVRSSNIAEQLPDLIVSKMQESMEQQGESGDSENGAGPTEDEIADMKHQIADALPPETVNAIFDQVIDDGAAWWKSGDSLEEFPLVINIAPFKDEIKPLLQGTELITNEDGSLPDTINLRSLLQIEAQNKPDEFVKYNEQITQARTVVKQARTLTMIGWIVIGLCLLGIGLLIRTPGERVAKWFGWTGVMVLMQSLVLFAVAYFFPSFIRPLLGTSGVPAEAAAAFALLQSLSTTLWHGFAVATLCITVVVIGLFVAQSQLARKSKA